jgi:hypothetical protein
MAFHINFGDDASKHVTYCGISMPLAFAANLSGLYLLSKVKESTSEMTAP